MRSLSITSARSQLPSLIDDVCLRKETIIIRRRGKPVAKLTPVPPDPLPDETAKFPLRSISIVIPEDFDEPPPGLRETLQP